MDKMHSRMCTVVHTQQRKATMIASVTEDEKSTYYGWEAGNSAGRTLKHGTWTSLEHFIVHYNSSSVPFTSCVPAFHPRACFFLFHHTQHFFCSITIVTSASRSFFSTISTAAAFQRQMISTSHASCYTVVPFFFCANPARAIMTGSFTLRCV